MTWLRHTPLVGLLAVLAGCADAAGPAGDHALQVSVRAVNADASAYPQTSTTVEIQSVAFVLGGLKLETAGLDGTVDWVLDASAVIPLDLTGGSILAFDTEVPPGVYKELELSVDKLETGNPAEEPLIAAWSELADGSVLVKGVVIRDGGPAEPFTFTAPLDIDLELLFDEPVTFTAADNPVTLISLMIDLGGWFTGGTGPLDPTNPANRSDIEANIQRSLDLRAGG